MALTNISAADELGCERAQSSVYPESMQASASAVSWGAIVAGAAAIASLALILLMLGTGLGLSSVSPWAYSGVSATTFGVSTILWLTFTQIVASGMGGYLAGRLRTKWVSVHTDEVYFRDTAHGFLAWAIAARVKRAGKEFVGDQSELYLLDEQPGEETPYERLLEDAMAGDGALFTREDAVEAAWAVVDPVLTAHHKAHRYKPGSWGPKQADALVAVDGSWHNPILVKTTT